MNKTAPTKQLVIIGISSGIAAFKVIDLLKILKRKNIAVEVIMTHTAVKMFGKEMFEKVAGKKVYTDLIPDNFDYKQVLQNREVEHIKLADSASLFVIAPATANVIAKMAYGFADDLLTAAILATTAPILICPSMNVHMWENRMTQENLNKLKRLGYFIIHPDSGQLACGYQGAGRLATPQKISEEIVHLLYAKKTLTGKKILVTAGGTREAIDSVRFITNKGSGKMGAAIAEECHLRGADVLLLKSVTAINTSGVAGRSGNAGHDSPDGEGIRIEVFETAKELEKLIKKHAKDYDMIFHTAAVSDFIPEKQVDTKLDSGKSLTLKLKPAAKILHRIKSWNPQIKVIGFKAVYKKTEKEMVKIGIEKLKASHSDFIIVNDVGRDGIGFGTDDNEVYVISQKGFIKKIDKSPKRTVARILLDIIFSENV